MTVNMNFTLNEAYRFGSSTPDDLRSRGWTVGCHNDYRQAGKLMTFWLLTNKTFCVKGEGESDVQALNTCRTFAYLLDHDIAGTEACDREELLEPQNTANLPEGASISMSKVPTPFVDVLDLIHEFRDRFTTIGLEPPSVLIFDRREDGMALIHALTKKRFLIHDPMRPFGNPVDHPDGSVWMELNVLGQKVRWPAEKFPKKIGKGYRWA